MKRLDLFIIKSYIGPFVMTFFISVFVLMTQFIWKYIDDMVGKGLEWYTIIELLFYASFTFVPLALPLAVLLSSIMTFGNLGENYELVAMKSSGISLQKIMRPLVYFVFVLSISAFFFSNNLLPRANLKFRTLLKDVRQKKPAVSIKEGVFYSDITNYVIKIAKKDGDGLTIHDVIIYNHAKGSGNKDITIAKDGKMELTKDKRFLVFTLFDGYNYNENIQMGGNVNKSNLPMQKTNFRKEVRRIDLSAFAFRQSDEEMYKNNYEMLNVSQLSFFEDSLERQRDTAIFEFNNFVIDDFSFLKIYNDATLVKAVDSTSAVVPDTSERAATSTFNKQISALNSFVSRREDDRILPENVVFVVDTAIPLKANFLSNFDEADQNEIISSAVSNARSSSYHTDIVTDGLGARNLLIVKHKNEWHKKFALSFACFILFFIGAPLGAIIRKGGLGMPVVVSIFLFVIFHIFSIIGEKFTKEGIVSPMVGIWMASLVFLPLGIFLTIKATSDSPLFDVEIYQKVFKFLSLKKEINLR